MVVEEMEYVVVRIRSQECDRIGVPSLKQISLPVHIIHAHTHTLTHTLTRITHSLTYTYINLHIYIHTDTYRYMYTSR